MSNSYAIENFLEEVYYTDNDIATESPAIFAGIAAALIGVVAGTVTGNVIANHATKKETSRSLHITALTPAQWSECLKYIKIINDWNAKATSNPYSKEVRETQAEAKAADEKFLEILKQGKRLGFISGSDVRRVIKLSKKYSWFKGGEIDKANVKTAISEFQAMLDGGVDKYMESLLNKLINALKEIDGKNLILAITR